MNLNDMVALIQARLGFRDDLQTEIIREINLAQYQLERDPTFNPYFLWRAKDICICPDCLDYALPAGFIRLDEFSNPLYQAEGSFCANELDKALAGHTYEPSKGSNEPTAFSIYSSNLRLNGRGCGILRMFYITATTQLSVGVVENLWTDKAFALLMNKAGMSIASILQEQVALQFFTSEYFVALASFKKECVAYEDQGSHAARGDVLYKFPIKNVGGWYEAGTIPCEGCA